MPYYFIIDQHHCMSLFEAKDKSDAIDRFNDRNKVKADLCINANPCKHRNFKKPDLPDWMQYQAHGCRLCGCCSDIEESAEVADSVGLFKHEKSWL